MEMNVLNYCLKRYAPDIRMYIKNLKHGEDLDFGMSKREWKELDEKIK